MVINFLCEEANCVSEASAFYFKASTQRKVCVVHLPIDGEKVYPIEQFSSVQSPEDETFPLRAELNQCKASIRTIVSNGVTPLSTKVNILWTAKHSPFHVKISFNVIREICSYIGDVQKLIAVSPNQVKWYNVATNQWEQLLALRRNIIVDDSTSSTFIAPSTIFVCGGGKKISILDVGNSAYVLGGDGSVQELPHMSTGRQAPGLAWDSVRQTLYVFGGSNGRGTRYLEYLRTSEMFLSKWSPLPDMRQARKSFNPCWYSSLLYLCGGAYTISVETYDPRSNTFTLQDYKLPEAGQTTAVVDSETLIVVSYGYISKLQQGGITSQKHLRYYSWSNCTPLISEGAVYITSLGDNCCRKVNLASGEKVTEVGLSSC